MEQKNVFAEKYDEIRRLDGMSGSYLCIPRNKTVISETELKCSVSQFLQSYICESKECQRFIRT